MTNEEEEYLIDLLKKRDHLISHYGGSRIEYYEKIQKEREVIRNILSKLNAHIGQ